MAPTVRTFLPPPTRLTYVLALIACVGWAGALYMTLTEPFSGTPLAYAGRLVTMTSLVGMSTARLFAGRWQGSAFVLAVIMTYVGLALVIAGHWF